MPLPPKPPARRQRRNKRDATGARAVRPVSTLPVHHPPEARTQWLASTSRAWASFWSSDFAGLLCLDTDLFALLRLFDLRDERARMANVARKNRFLLGSKNQLVLNPAYRIISSMDTEIRALEDRFGLSPLGRLHLGVTFAAATRSLEDLHSESERLAGDPDETDPRMVFEEEDPKA
ncbi:MAG: hypothetical protein WDA27_05590 [Actinomycetota bacterium]